jgi:hypothetical protein
MVDTANILAELASDDLPGGAKHGLQDAFNMCATTPGDHQR